MESSNERVTCPFHGDRCVWSVNADDGRFNVLWECGSSGPTAKSRERAIELARRAVQATWGTPITTSEFVATSRDVAAYVRIDALETLAHNLYRRFEKLEKRVDSHAEAINAAADRFGAIARAIESVLRRRP